jgi:hypothetical protein
MHTALKEVNEKSTESILFDLYLENTKGKAPDKKSKWDIPLNERRGF